MSDAYLKEVLYTRELGPGLVAAVLMVAFVLGAIHALGPGHGKSLMAAYLVGARGRIRDALVLGVSITLSHVVSVVVLAFVALALSNYFWPERANVWLSIASGALILGIGVYLLISRWRGMRRGKESGLTTHGGAHAESGRQDEQHSEGHSPHAGAEYHHHFDTRLSLWGNIMLGISGGMVPCPKALVILLLAISLQRITLGLLIVLSFSLGLAVVLIAVGIIMVKGSHLLEGRWDVQRWAFLPVLGAVVIISLGGFLLIRSLSVL
ncbi:MAG: high frequency lysogenization protein HflD [Calditrichia bacterium]